jgi:hypothetical protein
MLTQTRLKELLLYNPETGVFIWLVRRGPCALAFSVAGSLNTGTRHQGGGYRKICIDGAEYYAHRLAWFYMTGAWPKHKIDHEDLDRGNNRFLNLREATVSQNGGNCEKRSNNTSGFKGVSWNKNAQKWIANIQHQGKYKYLGLHESAEAAHKAYSEASKELFKTFSRI